MESILNLLGLARKAGRVVCGEEAVSEAAEGKKIRLLLYAGDAAANSCRRALTFAAKGSCLALQLPCGKADMGRAVGYAECAMLGVTDIGFAGAIGKEGQNARLAARLTSYKIDIKPESYRDED